MYSYNSQLPIDLAVFWLLAFNVSCVIWVYLSSNANTKPEAKNLVSGLTFISFVIAIGFAVTPDASARDLLPTMLVFCTFVVNFGYCAVLETMPPHDPYY